MDSRGTRWLVLGGFWAVQALVLVAAFILFYGSTHSGEWELERPRAYFDALWDDDVRVVVAVWLPILTGLQALLVLPVQMPLKRGGRGKSVYLSLAAAGAMLGMLVVAFGAAVCELVVLYDLAEARGWSWPLIGVSLTVSWAFFSTLLVRYAHRSRLGDDDLVTRVARIVFAGTIVETAALIPIDVMVRRRTDCYCWAGSLWALMLSGAIGLIVAGPAVLLPLFAPRPRWLRAGRCIGCGYSRAGLAPGTACPECGTTPGEP